MPSIRKQLTTFNFIKLGILPAKSANIFTFYSGDKKDNQIWNKYYAIYLRINYANFVREFSVYIPENLLTNETAGGRCMTTITGEGQSLFLYFSPLSPPWPRQLPPKEFSRRTCFWQAKHKTETSKSQYARLNGRAATPISACRSRCVSRPRPYTSDHPCLPRDVFQASERNEEHHVALWQRRFCAVSLPRHSWSDTDHVLDTAFL